MPTNIENYYSEKEKLFRVYRDLPYEEKFKQGRELYFNKPERLSTVEDIRRYLEGKVEKSEDRTHSYINFIWEGMDNSNELFSFFVYKQTYKENGLELSDEAVSFINSGYQSISKSSLRICFLSFLNPISLNNTESFNEKSSDGLKKIIFKNEVALIELSESFKRAAENRIVLEGINPWIGWQGGISTRDSRGILDGVRESFDVALRKVKSLVSHSNNKNKTPIASISHLVAKTTGRWSYLEKWLPYIEKVPDNNKSMHEMMWGAANTGSFSDTIGIIFNFPRYSKVLNDLKSSEDWDSFFNVIDRFIERGFFKLPNNYSMSVHDQLSIFNSHLERQLALLLVDYVGVDKNKLCYYLDKVNQELPKLSREQFFDSTVLFYFTIMNEKEETVKGFDDTLFFNNFSVSSEETLFKCRLLSIDSAVVEQVGGWSVMVDEAVKKKDAFVIKLLWSLSGLLNELGRGELFETLMKDSDKILQENKEKFFDKEEFLCYYSTIKTLLVNSCITKDSNKSLTVFKAKLGRDVWSTEFESNERMDGFDFSRSVNNALSSISDHDANITEIRLKPLEYGFKKWVSIQSVSEQKFKKLISFHSVKVEGSDVKPNESGFYEEKRDEKKQLSMRALNFLTEKLNQADCWKEKYGSLVGLNERSVDDEVLVLKIIPFNFLHECFAGFIADEVSSGIDKRIIDSFKVHAHALFRRKSNTEDDGKTPASTGSAECKAVSYYWTKEDFVELISSSFIENKGYEGLGLLKEAAFRYPSGVFYGMSFSKLKELYSALSQGELSYEQKKELNKNPTVNVLLSFVLGRASDFEKSLKSLNGIDGWMFKKCTPFELFSESCSYPESNRFSGGVWFKKMEKMIDWMSFNSLLPEAGAEKMEDPILSKKRIFYLSARLWSSLIGCPGRSSESKKKMDLAASNYFNSQGKDLLRVEDLSVWGDTWKNLSLTAATNVEDWVTRRAVSEGTGVFKANNNTIQEKMVIASTVFRAMDAFSKWFERQMIRDADFTARMGSLLFDGLMSGKKNIGYSFVSLTSVNVVNRDIRSDTVWLMPWLLSVIRNEDVIFFNDHKENSIENKKEFLETMKKFLTDYSSSQSLPEYLRKVVFNGEDGEKLGLLLVAACNSLEGALLLKENGQDVTEKIRKDKKGLRF